MQADGITCRITHGAVVIAAITSCTNTSNPSVMLGAGLLAKTAVERGLNVKPYVKTSLAPGSRVVTDYFERAGLTPYLKQLGFHTVGYGCTTCIGNSGPLPDAVAKAVTEGDLVAAAVLSGNRNFEGRVNPLVKANYLASPPLVVAYALAGTTDIDLIREPLGTDKRGQRVFLKDIWPTRRNRRAVAASVSAGDVPTSTQATLRSQPAVAEDRHQRRRAVRLGPREHVHAGAPLFRGLPKAPGRSTDHRRAGAGPLGDSVTTDHISPAGSIAADTPAGLFLHEHGVSRSTSTATAPPRQRPGDDARHALPTSASGTCSPRHGRGRDAIPAHGPKCRIYDAAMKYQARERPLMVLAGAEYGTGTTRDWAAKGTLSSAPGGHRHEFRAHPP